MMVNSIIKKYHLVAGVLVFLLFGSKFEVIAAETKNSRLIVALSQKWDDLRPARVNTLSGYQILTNSFESLVGYTEKGFYEPRVATSWTIDENFRTFTFEIDTSKHFSDGSSLDAYDIKKSWENSFAESTEGLGLGNRDTLSLLLGAENFKRQGHISGIEVVAPNRLTLKLKKPCRTFLSRLSSLRMSVTKKNLDQQLIGTGPYIIQKRSDIDLLLTKNPYFEDSIGAPNEIQVRYLPIDKAQRGLVEGEIDIMQTNSLVRDSFCDPTSERLQCVDTLDATHVFLALNGMGGKVFSDPRLRKAMQYLIYKAIRNNPAIETIFAQNFQLDSQVFLPLQAGRLPRTEIENILNQGEPYVPLLVQTSQETPLRFLARADFSPLLEELKRNGLQISHLKINTHNSKWLDAYFKDFDVDMILMSLSVTNGDPDGLYHILGENGSLASPMTLRKKTATLLEQGRSLLIPEEIHKHYQTASRAVLDELPFVHLGFIRKSFVFRKDRIKLKDSPLQYKYDDFFHFEKL